MLLEDAPERPKKPSEAFNIACTPAPGKPLRQKPEFCERRRVSSRHFVGNVQSAPNLPFVALVFSRGTNKRDPLIVQDVLEEGIFSSAPRFKFLLSENRIVDFASELSLKLSHRFRQNFLMRVANH